MFSRVFRENPELSGAKRSFLPFLCIAKRVAGHRVNSNYTSHNGLFFKNIVMHIYLYLWYNLWYKIPVDSNILFIKDKALTTIDCNTFRKSFDDISTKSFSFYTVILTVHLLSILSGGINEYKE